MGNIGTTILTYIPRMFKSLVAFVGSASAAYGLAQVDGVTKEEWAYVIATGLGVAWGVWQTRNALVPDATASSSGPQEV